MPDVQFTNLLLVAVIALLAPLTLGLAPRLRLPAVVLEIVAGGDRGRDGVCRVVVRGAVPGGRVGVAALASE